MQSKSGTSGLSKLPEESREARRRAATKKARERAVVLVKAGLFLGRRLFDDTQVVQGVGTRSQPGAQRFVTYFARDLPPPFVPALRSANLHTYSA